VSTSTTQRRKVSVLRRAAASAAIAALMALIGCGADIPGTSGTSPTTDTSTTAGSATVTDADVHFASSMNPHLDQAVEMSKMLQEKAGVAPEVRSVAKQIQTTQEPQIDTLNGWLKTWGRPFGSDDGSGAEEEGSANHHGGNGLMSELEMQTLDMADGAAGQKLYLDGMITHHQGALAMAEIEIKDGKNPDAVQFARNIVKDQNHEIATMQNLLAQL